MRPAIMHLEVQFDQPKLRNLYKLGLAERKVDTAEVDVDFEFIVCKIIRI